QGPARPRRPRGGPVGCRYHRPPRRDGRRRAEHVPGHSVRRGERGGTAKLIQALVDGHRVKKLLVASSMSIYGEGAYACPTHGAVAPLLREEAQLAKKHWESLCRNCGKVLTSIAAPETNPLQTHRVYAATTRAQE